nr:immunoglobulin heavy chain junction region [Mus musculus]
CTGDWYFDVW